MTPKHERERPDGPSATASTSHLVQLLPIVGWMKRYDRADLPFDLVAGVTLAAFAVPESLAYASLAGLEPQIGLYAGIAAMVTYAVFGSSPQLGVGVTSALAIMAAASISGLAGGDAQKAAAMAAFSTLIAGGAALLARLFRLGFLSNLVSRSVLTGFSAGAGLYIASTQLAKLFGVQAGEGEFFSRIADFSRHIADTDKLTLGLGIAAGGLLLLGRRFTPRLPSPLIVVALALLAATLFHLDARGVEVVGAIPRGLPSPSLPSAAFPEWRSLIAPGLSLFVLSYVEGVSAARSLGARHGGHLAPNQELLANGVGNVVSGLFHGMPVGGSLTRSSVNVESGARTQLASAVGGAVLVVVVAFLTGVFSKLPETVLAAVVLVAVVELIELKAIGRIFARSKREFIIAVLTGFGVLLFGILWGIVLGVVLSLLDLLERATFPHTAELGRIPNTRSFADRDAHPEYVPAPGALIVRVDASVVFANASTIKEDIVARVRQNTEPIDLLVLDLEASPLMDLSGTDMIDELGATLEAEGITMKVAGANASVRHLLGTAASGRFDDLEPGMDVEQAVKA